mmetsp:Transcript_87800/g.277566  ORF Transcript_87800/g.277566 Transcript_87800/m.277566 type:complete len:269 (-) Transcript_87800:245-1051(-)
MPPMNSSRFAFRSAFLSNIWRPPFSGGVFSGAELTDCERSGLPRSLRRGREGVRPLEPTAASIEALRCAPGCGGGSAPPRLGGPGARGGLRGGGAICCWYGWLFWGARELRLWERWSARFSRRLRRDSGIFSPTAPSWSWSGCCRSITSCQLTLAGRLDLGLLAASPSPPRRSAAHEFTGSSSGAGSSPTLSGEPSGQLAGEALITGLLKSVCSSGGSRSGAETMVRSRETSSSLDIDGRVTSNLKVEATSAREGAGAGTSAAGSGGT